MPRRSDRTSTKRSAPPTAATEANDVAVVIPRRPAKRVKASEPAPVPAPTSSTRTKRPKATSKKSTYFEAATPQNEEDDEKSSEPESVILNEESGYEDDDLSAVISSDSDGVEQGEENSDDFGSRPRQSRAGGSATRSRQPARKKATPQKEKKKETVLIPSSKELLREGVRTGLGPGKQVRIKIPQAREAGNVPYREDRIHPNTLLFLSDLRENNDRDWLKLHDKDFRNAQKDFESFVEKLTEKIVEKDDTIPAELPTKDLIMRIYRDMRFSSDPTPYRTHFGVGWSRTGRKGPYAGYFLALEPGNSFIAGGLWMPEASHLALLRRAIDRRPERIKSILMQSELRKEFLHNVEADEEKAVTAFVAGSSENALKTKPKGFDSGHRDIALLRLRSFTLSRKLPDDIFSAADSSNRIADFVGILTPFITYLNSVVMPDVGGSSESESSENNEQSDG